MSADLFNADETPFNLAGELIDNSTTPEGEARVRALAENEARKAQLQLGTEQDCQRCEETFVSPTIDDYCPKCARNMNRTDMRRPHEARGSAASNACFGAY